MKTRNHGLDEREMELVKLLMADRKNDFQIKIVVQILVNPLFLSLIFYNMRCVFTQLFLVCLTNCFICDIIIKQYYCAAVVKSADTRDLKSLGRNTVPVQVRSAAPSFLRKKDI